MFHLEFSRKERTYISIGKTNIGIIQTLKSSLELVNTLIKNDIFFIFSCSKIILSELKVLNILYSIRAKSILKDDYDDPIKIQLERFFLMNIVSIHLS